MSWRKRSKSEHPEIAIPGRATLRASALAELVRAAVGVEPGSGSTPRAEVTLVALRCHHHGVTHRNEWTMPLDDHQVPHWTTPSGDHQVGQRHHRPVRATQLPGEITEADEETVTEPATSTSDDAARNRNRPARGSEPTTGFTLTDQHTRIQR